MPPAKVASKDNIANQKSCVSFFLFIFACIKNLFRLWLRLVERAARVKTPNKLTEMRVVNIYGADNEREKGHL